MHDTLAPGQEPEQDIVSNREKMKQAVAEPPSTRGDREHGQQDTAAFYAAG